ncbi:hypothetical protein [Solimonas marina]|uniref:Uncharacterized protein n=1 Tax=Solimonas marina TaxID=2714601 RepID=A0A969W8L4_9GAMM|nr:hypothetical protein [Solimonas marina]NKF21535.1 hypothetical protein [Solimonas marina]
MSTLPRDTSVWLDQIEHARHQLLLTIRSRPLDAVAGTRAQQIDDDVQALVDGVIDRETQEVKANG